MTERDQREWVRMLGKTPSQQRLVIADLLRHANEDHMSSADRTICKRQLDRLTREPWKA